MMPSEKYSSSTAERPADTNRSGGLWTRQLELMQSKKESKSGREGQEPFVTIDDLLQKAGEIFAGLKKLAEYKYPLDIRRGSAIRKGVSKVMDEDRESMQIKASGRTYFLDVEKTKEGKPYLKITESRKGKEDKFERSSVLVFPEDADEFSDAVSEMVGKLG